MNIIRLPNNIFCLILINLIKKRLKIYIYKKKKGNFQIRKRFMKIFIYKFK